MDRDEVLRVRNLNVFYKNRKRKLFSKKKKIQALYDVNVSMEEGEVLAIAGESGSGKSTLARAIVGINKDYTGEIWIRAELFDDYAFIVKSCLFRRCCRRIRSTGWSRRLNSVWR